MGVVQEAYGFTITAVQSSLEFKRPHCGRFKSHLRDMTWLIAMSDARSLPGAWLSHKRLR